MIELIFATGNAHKLTEVTDILDQDWLQIQSLKDMGFTEDIAETGDSLSANARIKSQTIYKSYNKNVFSEDTGLEVMALGMAPGIYTARYAGPDRDAGANMDRLLEALSSSTDRTARFRTVVSLIWEGTEYQFEGIVNGTIAREKKGSGGFGYDPIFIPYGYEQSFAELDKPIKNAISHRYRAMMGLKKWLEAHRSL